MRITRDSLAGSPLSRSSENLAAHFALATSWSSQVRQQSKPALRPSLSAVAHRPYQSGWRPQRRAQISAMRMRTRAAKASESSEMPG